MGPRARRGTPTACSCHPPISSFGHSASAYTLNLRCCIEPHPTDGGAGGRNGGRRHPPSVVKTTLHTAACPARPQASIQASALHTTVSRCPMRHTTCASGTSSAAAAPSAAAAAATGSEAAAAAGCSAAASAASSAAAWSPSVQANDACGWGSCGKGGLRGLSWRGMKMKGRWCQCGTRQGDEQVPRPLPP